jgi:hypothetical protein
MHVTSIVGPRFVCLLGLTRKNRSSAGLLLSSLPSPTQPYVLLPEEQHHHAQDRIDQDKEL